MMRGRCVLVVAACAALLSLGGCLSAGEVAQKRQFLIAPQIAAAAATPTAHTLGVRPLFAARPYTLNMLYVDDAQALLPYADVFWAEEPDATVTRALRDAIGQSGRFADVGDAAEMARPEYVLTGEVRKYHEERAASPPQAVVEARLELREARGAKLVWAETVSASTPLEGARAQDYANAMTATVAALASKAAAAIAAVPLP